MNFFLEHLQASQLYGLDPWDQREKRRVLQERHGYISNLDPILDKIWRDILDSNQKEGSLFLDSYGLSFISSGTIRYNIDSQLVRMRGSSPDQFKVQDGKACNIEIEVEVGGSFLYVREQNFKVALSHELLHTYEIVRRVVGKKEPDYIKQRMYYRDAIEYISNPKKYFQEVGRFLYYDNASERNAYVGELRAELKPYADELGNSTTALERIKEIEVFRRYWGIETYISKLKEEIGRDNEKGLHYLELWNALVPEKYQHGTAKALLQDLEKRWCRFRKKFYTVAGKICFDLYNETKEIRKGLPMEL